MPGFVYTSLYGDLFTDCTMGFITIFNHHLGEYVLCFFFPSIDLKQIQGCVGARDIEDADLC